MRFNERELAALANSGNYTLEGALMKRAKFSDKFKDRYLRLKYNILFYFQVVTQTDSKGNERKIAGELVGAILLENILAKETPDDGRLPNMEYGFALLYKENTVRPEKYYEFRTNSKSEVSKWIMAIRNSSISSLKARFAYLKSQLLQHNVRLSSTEKLSTDSAMPVVVYSNIQQLKSAKSDTIGNCTEHITVSANYSDIPTTLLPTSILNRSVIYSPKNLEKGTEIKIVCKGLPFSPKLGHYVIVKLKIDKNSSAQQVSRTETIRNKQVANFASTILLDKDYLLCLRHNLVFELIQVEEKEQNNFVHSVFKKYQITVKELFLLEERFFADSLVNSPILIIRTIKPITCFHLKPQKFYEKFYKHSHSEMYCRNSNPCDFLFLNPLFPSPIRRTYELKLDAPLTPSRDNLQDPLLTFSSPKIDAFKQISSLKSYDMNSTKRLHVMESVSESLYNNAIPIEYLKLCISDNYTMIDKISSLGALLSVDEKTRSNLLYLLLDLTLYYKSQLQTLIELQYSFRYSSKRYDARLSFVPINLHLCKLSMATIKDPIPLPSIVSPLQSVTAQAFSATNLVFPRPEMILGKKRVDLHRSSSDQSFQIEDYVIQSSRYTTMGASTHHVAGFNEGSLLTMLQSSQRLPYFIFARSNKTRELLEIANDLNYFYVKVTENKDFLMRIIANSDFSTIPTAMEGIFKSVQNFFRILEKEEVTSSIQNYRKIAAHFNYDMSTTDSIKRHKQFVPKSEPIRHSWAVTSQDLQICTHLRLAEDKTHTPNSNLLMDKISKFERQVFDILSLLYKKVDQVEAQIVVMRKSLSEPSQHKQLVSWSEMLIPLLSSLTQKVYQLYSLAEKGLTLSRMQIEGSLTDYDDVLERNDVIISQLLTCLVSNFALSIQEEIDNSAKPINLTRYLNLCTRVGYLFSVESYLSIYGDEKYILEDLSLGVQQLSAFKLRLACGCCHSHPQIIGSRINPIVLLPICPFYYKAIPVKIRESDISIYPFIFSRNVTYCDIPEKSSDEDNSIKFVSNLNSQSVLALYDYYISYSHLSSPLPTQVKQNLDILRREFNSDKVKRVDNASQYVELFDLIRKTVKIMGGGVAVMCKSGKDRTGCASIWNQTQFIRENQPTLSEENHTTLLRAMQTSGAKVDICLKNSGVAMFAIAAKNINSVASYMSPPPEMCAKSLHI